MLITMTSLSLDRNGAWFARKGIGNAAFFRRHPKLRKHAESLTTRRPEYLVHEYLSEHGRPMYFADVAREMAEARLDFVGQAALTKNMAS